MGINDSLADGISTEESGQQDAEPSAGDVRNYLVAEVMLNEIAALQSARSFLSTGVRGAFQRLWGLVCDGMISSVYAEVARRHGWLRPDRVLPESAYREIAQASASWCEQDRSLADLLAAFGPPSLGLGPTNPRCSKTMTYLTDSLSDPCLSFHLWNNRGPGSRDREYPEPMLLAVRRESDHFADSFTFTPLGREHASA